ncbi:hypothetical protein [Halopiger xanaduensis]|uniref:Uncharacterized protein n=1 Tax=Halopiger xanaduensis (strain DSM 18323 / JCM 14033 / SH-6) TaxID=797210 RepID=F8DCF7_HALXS|nr:hypothetical protein [Halopiger xanaduensis]AEH38418.1 hypothetical protein Halxa_3812 [Halopiger xanaduensis SH-6]
MADQPPSPPTPTTDAQVPADDDRVLATTAQLARTVEDALGVSLEPSTLEDLLLELDRQEYVEWVTVTRTGDYVWDLSESPDRIADAVAEAVVARIDEWIAEQTDAQDGSA